jgi:cytochrome c
MKFNKYWVIGISAILIIGCSSSDKGSTTNKIDKKVEKKADDSMKNIGIGPISHIELASTIDQSLAATGKEVYNLKCTACHKVDEKFIGPPPAGIMERRSPEWIMNMILNPEEMIAKDPVAIKLLAEYNFAPMANQSLTEDEARAILEYFRTL